MTKSTNKRVLRRQVRRGMLEEIKRRSGRDVSSSAEVRQMITEKILEKERAKAIADAPLT